MTKEKYVKICPRCKSIDVHMEKSDPLVPAAGLPAQYVCNKCGNMNNVFPEIAISEIDNIKDLPKEDPIEESRDKHKMVDTSYGNFQVNIYWKLTGPILLILALFGLQVSLIPSLIFTLIAVFMIYTAYLK